MGVEYCSVEVKDAGKSVVEVRVIVSLFLRVLWRSEMLARVWLR